MKILQIINSLGTGGAEKLLLDTLPLYREKGIEMDILVFWNNNHQFINAMKALNCCKVMVLKESENYKDIYSISHIWKLRKYLKEYDIAHIHLFPAQYFTVFTNVLIGNKCKLIFTEHNTTNRRIEKSYFKPIEQFVYSQYEKLVCISNEIERIYINYLPKLKNKSVVIHNGVNVAKINQADPIPKLNLHPDIKSTNTILLQVSAFRTQKDQKTLIKALSLLKNNVILVFVGDGETLSECKSLVKSLLLEKRVFFVGQRMDIPQLLKTADIVVLSSKYEGLSLSSIEGMAAGKPFLASDVPGLSDVVRGAGVLFEAGNAGDLAAKIKELLENKTLYENTVKDCQIRAAQYDIYKMVEKHIQLYREVYEA
ncbi:MAG TPA: glycosyltransferase [Flavobacterium sp.]|nr:glycosyltransferase [Flavobacterium sp.]